MTPLDEEQTPPVDPPTEPPPKDEYFPPPPKRSPPPNTPPPAPTLDMRATFDSLQLVNSIRESVVRDIVDKDSARLADVLSVRLAPQLRDQIKTGVSAEFADRAKVFGAIAGMGGIVLGFVGYQSLSQSLEVSAKQAAQEAAVTAAESEVKKRSSVIVADMQSMRDSLVDQIEFERESIDRSTEKAQQAAVETILRVTDHANTTSREFNKQIEDSTKALLTEARQAAVAEVDKAKLDLRTEYGRTQAALARLVEEKRAEIASAGNVVKSQVSSLPANSAGTQSASVASGGQVPAPDDPGRQERLERALKLDVERRFDLSSILNVAQDYQSAGDSRGYRSVFDPIYNNPAAFTSEERLLATQLMTADWVPLQERRSIAIEMMIAAARVGDAAMFDAAEAIYDVNVYTVSQAPDPFVALIKLAFRSPASIDAQAAFQRVEPDNLTLRGRLNLIYLGKAIGVTGELDSLLRNVLDALFDPRGDDVAYLDRYTDYTSASHVLDVLLKEPLVERERVGIAVQRIKELIFPSDKAADPFDLRKRIDEFLGS